MNAALNAVYYAVDLKAAHRAAEEFRQRYAKIYPSAVACFDDDLDVCLNHLRCPAKNTAGPSARRIFVNALSKKKNAAAK